MSEKKQNCKEKRPDNSALLAGSGDELVRQLERPLAPGLYVVATPIGNLGDVTLRALATLAGVDAIYCEDKRVSTRLLSHFGISKPLKSYHEHNGAIERPHILAALKAGGTLALISDAGTPLLSDPGYKLVRDVLAAGIDVVALPGASALLTALAGSPMPTDSFYFAGFLPSRQGARRARLGALQAIATTIVFYESPRRLAAALEDIDVVFGPRRTAVARELTKLHEQRRVGLPGELAGWARDTAPKGEMVILVGPAAVAEPDDELISQRLALILDDMSLRDAVKTLAAELDLPRRRVYALAVAIKNAGN